MARDLAPLEQGGGVLMPKVTLDAINGKRVLFAVDFSGSVATFDPNGEVYRRPLFALALHVMQKGISGALGSFDHQFHPLDVFSPDDVEVLVNPPPFRGGGGGDLGPVMVAARAEAYDQVVIIGDGENPISYAERHLADETRAVFILTNGVAENMYERFDLNYMVLV
jgi:hypothetical protein